MSLNQIIRQSISLGESMVKIPFEMAKDMMGRDQANQSGTQQMMITGMTIGENLASIPFQIAREMVQDSRLDENIVVIDPPESKQCNAQS